MADDTETLTTPIHQDPATGKWVPGAADPTPVPDAPKEVPGPSTTTEPVTPAPRALEPPKSVVPSATETLYPRVMSAIEKGIERNERREAEYEESQRRVEEAQRHQREVTRPEREGELRDIDEERRFLREHPRQPPAPLPERPKLRYDLGELFGPEGQGREMMNAIATFAAVSGRTTQERLMFAVTAMHGMVQGWAKGKTDDFNQRYKEWQDAVENIRETESRKRQYVNDVLNDRKISSELRARKLELLGMEDQDTMTMELARQKNLVALDTFSNEKFGLLDKAMKYAGDFDKHVTTVKDNATWDLKAEQHFAGDEREALRGVTSRNVDKYYEALNRYGVEHGMSQAEIAQAGIAAQNKVDAQRIAVRRLATAGPAAVAAIQKDVSVGRVAVDLYERLARKQIDTWAAAAMKLDDTNSTVLNRWERWLKKEYAGDSDVFAFDLLSLSVRNEVQRVLTNTRMSAILTVSAQQEGKDWMDHGLPKDAVWHIAFVIKQEFDNRIKSIDEEQQIVNDAQDVMSKELGVTTVTPKFSEPPSAPGAGALPTMEYDPATGAITGGSPSIVPGKPTFEYDPASGTVRAIAR